MANGYIKSLPRELQGLPADELLQIRGAIDAHLQIKKQISGEGDLSVSRVSDLGRNEADLLHAIFDIFRLPRSHEYGWLRRSQNVSTLKQATKQVCEFFDEMDVETQSRRRFRLAFFEIMAIAAASYLRVTRPQAARGPLHALQALRDPDVVFDQGFPGYRSDGMIMLLLEHMCQRLVKGSDVLNGSKR